MLKKIKKYFITQYHLFNWKDNIYSIVWAVVFATLFRTFLFQPFVIPSGSMIPTLNVDDRLFVTQYSYGYSRWSAPWGLMPIKGRIFFKSPKRGDIIVFKGVKDPETFYIKRLIGLPGDIIKVKNGDLYINHKRIEREKVEELKVRDDKKNVFNAIRYEEHLAPELTYSVLSIENPKPHSEFDPDNTPEYVVPEKHYFFMGDNRNNSIDSRFLDRNIGYVPEENLVGRASFLFWTSDFSIIDFITKFKTGRAFSFIKP